MFHYKPFLTIHFGIPHIFPFGNQVTDPICSWTALGKDPALPKRSALARERARESWLGPKTEKDPIAHANYSAGPKLRISFWKRNMFTVFRSKFFWFMQIFTICRVYAEKWPLRKIFWAKQISEITNRKSQLRTWQSPVFTGSLFFCFFFGLTLKFQNHARVSPFLFKIQAWCRKSWKYWFEHGQEHANIYIYIYLYLF